jgi:thiol-disulfide isomerase/thioredoxin
MRILIPLAAGAACLLLSGCVYWQALGGGSVAGSALFGSVWENRSRPQPLADFSVALFDGSTKRTADFAGQPLVVNFWADWCPPCVAEMPDFQAVYTERAGQFQLLGIAAESSKDAAGFVKQNGYTWTFGKSADAFAAYQVRGIPTTLFVDRSGRVVDQHVGGMDRATFEAKLARIL